MNGWQEQKLWSDRFMPEIKGILGQTLIGAAPIQDDQRRNTDLIVLKMEAVRIACRIRKFKYFDRYASQFTLRAGVPSGAKTELTKVIEGWGDCFFYGFANEDESGLLAWKLADLKVFRVEFMRMVVRNEGRLPGIPQDNSDGSSNFLAFTWADFSPELIIAQSNGATPSQRAIPFDPAWNGEDF